MKLAKHDIIATVNAQFDSPIIQFKHIYSPSAIKAALGIPNLYVTPGEDEFKFSIITKGQLYTIDAPKRPHDGQSIAIFEKCREALQKLGWTVRATVEKVIEPKTHSAQYVIFFIAKEPGATVERNYVIKVFLTSEAYSAEKKIFESEQLKTVEKRLQEIKKISPDGTRVIIPKLFLSESDVNFSVMFSANGKTLFELQLPIVTLLGDSFLPKNIIRDMKQFINSFLSTTEKGGLPWAKISSTYQQGVLKIIGKLDDLDTEVITRFAKLILETCSGVGEQCGRFDGADFYLSYKTDSLSVKNDDSNHGNITYEKRNQSLTFIDVDRISLEKTLYTNNDRLFVQSSVVSPYGKITRPLFYIQSTSVIRENIGLLGYFLYIGTQKQFETYMAALENFMEKIADQEFTTHMQTTIFPRLENMFLSAMEGHRAILQLS